MRIDDSKGTYQTKNSSELETVLQRRYGPGLNSFWLSHDGESYPTVALLVKGDLACLHYFPKDSHPGFLSIGPVQELKPDGATTFLLDNLDEAEMPNSSVVYFHQAVEVAKEFLASKELPKSVQWIEL